MIIIMGVSYFSRNSPLLFTALNFISASADWKILHVLHIIAFWIHNLEYVDSKKQYTSFVLSRGVTLLHSWYQQLSNFKDIFIFRNQKMWIKIPRNPQKFLQSEDVLCFYNIFFTYVRIIVSHNKKTGNYLSMTELYKPVEDSVWREKEKTQ